MNYKTKISIDGSYLNTFEKVNLKQTINDHHEFKIVVDHDEIEALGSHTLDASKEWLGKSVIISFDQTEFSGIVTHINLLHNNGHSGLLEVSGYSKTILLEQGNHTTSWLNKNLESIFKETVAVVDFETKIKPQHKGVLEYEAQYGESHFDFIKRLCKQHNEWLYWDGIKLIVGKPTLEEPISLQYGQELSNMNIGMKIKANSYTTFSYNSGDDTRHESSTKNDVKGMNELGMDSLNTSLEIFKTKVNTHSIARVKDKSELDISLKKKQSAIAADLHVLEADCSKQNITIGSVIKVSSAKWDGRANFDIQNYGEYLVIDIEHKATGQTTYSSHFKAISSSIEVLPEPTVTIPQAHSQIGTIIDNVDPKGYGRVKAQLLWQKQDQTTTWLRVMTPDAGKSDAHGEIRGNLIIPEIGDQVVVGFRYGDPNRAYVMGSLYNGGNIKAGKENRNSLVSRMGSKMIMDDNDGSLQLTDKGGVDMRFDGAGNSKTTINANNTVNTGSTNIFNVGNTQSINVGAKKDTPPQSTLTMDDQGNILLEGKTTITLKVGESSITITEDEIKTLIAKGNITTEATTGENKMISNALDITSKTTCSVKATSTMEIVGSEVEINKK